MCIHKRFPFSAIYRTSIVMLYLTSMYLSIYLNTYKIKNQKTVLSLFSGFLFYIGSYCEISSETFFSGT